MSFRPIFLKHFSLTVLVFLFIFPFEAAIAQSLMEKQISVNLKDKRVASVLAVISQRGRFCHIMGRQFQRIV